MFETTVECEAACGAAPPPPPPPPPADVCELDLVVGPCEAVIKPWGLNGELYVEAAYGGCRGNGNGFETQEECEAACAEAICALPTISPDQINICRSLEPSWTFPDVERTAFYCFGCEGTANVFDSEEDCLALCGPYTTATATETVATDTLSWCSALAVLAAMAAVLEC